MRHVSESTLRRQFDEPFAVSDMTTDHLAHCSRCRERSEQIASDARVVSAFLSRPHVVPDPDRAWARLQAALPDRSAAQRRHSSPRAHGWRVASGVRAHFKGTIAATAFVAAAATAAVVLATGSGPSKAPNLNATSSDVGVIANLVGIDGSGVLGGFRTPSGVLKLPFGTMRWTSAAPPYKVASIAEANKATGLDARLPSALPSGVAQPYGIVVQPKVTATIDFGSGSGSLNGRTLTISAGPGVLVEYGGLSSGANVPTLLVLTVGPPTTSSRAPTAQLEAFVLTRRGLPPTFTEEISLLRDITSTRRFTPSADAVVSSVKIKGSPGVVVTYGSDAVSGVVWEDRGGLVHVALGLLDKEDILDVANQIG